jgi:hypothetical protein
MALSYKLQENILLITCDCCFTRKDAIECFKNAIRDRFYKKEMPVLIDSTDCEIILPFQAVKLILEFLGKQSGRFAPRFAFVERDPSPVRLGQIFSVLAKDYGLECRSFHKYDDAREWLFQANA